MNDTHQVGDHLPSTSLRDILQRATEDINKHPVSKVEAEPVDLSKPPAIGVTAGKLVEDYGSHAADYVEKQAKEVMEMAENYHHRCLQLAENLRSIAAMQRKENEDLTTKLRAAAIGMGEVTKAFFGKVPPSE